MERRTPNTPSTPVALQRRAPVVQQSIEAETVLSKPLPLHRELPVFQLHSERFAPAPSYGDARKLSSMSALISFRSKKALDKNRWEEIRKYFAGGIDIGLAELSKDEIRFHYVDGELGIIKSFKNEKLFHAWLGELLSTKLK